AKPLVNRQVLSFNIRKRPFDTMPFSRYKSQCPYTLVSPRSTIHPSLLPVHLTLYSTRHKPRYSLHNSYSPSPPSSIPTHNPLFLTIPYPPSSYASAAIRAAAIMVCNRDLRCI